MPPSITVPKFLDPRIQPNKLCRNGRAVSTSVEHFARRVANQIRAYEGRELFSMLGQMPTSQNDVGNRERWRFRSKTSALASRVRVVMRMAMQGYREDPAPDPRATFELLDSSGSSIGTVTHHFGLSPDGPPIGGGNLGDIHDTPDEFVRVTGYVDVPGGTEVIGIFTEYDHARLVSALVYDEGPQPTKANGYLVPAATQGGNIYSADRERLVDVVNAWPELGSQVFNLNCDDVVINGYTVTGTTPKNIIDRSSTTVSAATPGFFFDGTGKALARQTNGVPVKVWVYGSASDEGYVDIKDSTGTTLETVVITSLGWHSVDVILPASDAKYDLHAYASAGGETVTVYAVSIYEDG